MPNTMTIGTLAKMASVNIETIRYYQRIGLIEQPVKPAQGYRRYPVAVAERVQFIKRAQELGFTLNEITDLLSLEEQDCAQAREIAEHKCQLIRKRVTDLKAMQAELEKLIAACERNTDRNKQCAIIETLSREQDTEQKTSG